MKYFVFKNQSCIFSHKTSAWGKYDVYSEYSSDNGFARREIIIYENGKILFYNLKGWCDEFGHLGDRKYWRFTYNKNVKSISKKTFMRYLKKAYRRDTKAMQLKSKLKIRSHEKNYDKGPPWFWHPRLLEIM